MRISISIDDNLLKLVDDYADQNFISRSGLITLVLNQFLQNQQAVNYLKDLSASFRKISETNKVDDETLSLLKDLEKFAEMVSMK